MSFIFFLLKLKKIHKNNRNCTNVSTQNHSEIKKVKNSKNTDFTLKMVPKILVLNFLRNVEVIARINQHQNRKQLRSKINSSLYYIPPDFKFGPKTEVPHEKDYSLLIFLTFLFFSLSFIIFGTLYKSIKHSIGWIPNYRMVKIIFSMFSLTLIRKFYIFT